MKNLIRFSLALIILFLINGKTYCIPGELIIYNYSTDVLKIRVYPIGAVFNGWYRYCLLCKNPSQNYDKIIGGEKENILYNNSFGLDHDGLDANVAEKAIGYGKYRVEFYKFTSGAYVLVNYCDVDYSDADYYFYDPLWTDFTGDIPLDYYAYNDIRYWGGAIKYHLISLLKSGIRG